MYPRLIEIPLPFEVFGIDTITIYSFGAMMAVAFLTAAWLSRIELDRLYKAGRIKGVQVPVTEDEQKKGKDEQKKAKKSKKARKARKRPAMREVSPSHLVGTLTIVAVVGGIAGAKLFHILENLGAFFEDPLGMIFSVGGLTFYGGLIVAAVSIAWYLRKRSISAPTFADAVLPTVLLAYGIGRIGCHLAGDGDWGIEANPAARPSWLPTWLWAETYPNNILDTQLPAAGVYPTSLYEFGMCLVLFGILWVLRKHPFKAGWLLSLTLIFFGIERFLIEQIRVNNTFDLFGLTFTQAEMISVILVTLGIVGLVRTTKKRSVEAPTDPRPKVASTAA